MKNLIIGVDFDNTIISYDNLFHKIAIELNLIPPETSKSKKEVRDALRKQPNGEIEWQRLQAMVYGWRIREAEPIPRVRKFFELCKKKKAKVYIISHKTQHSNLGESDYDLRKAAMQWMKQNHFFESKEFGLLLEHVFFGKTREEKLECIKKLGCTHYIDDLEETFQEKSFPKNVEKILYAPHSHDSSIPGVKIFNSWDDITNYFFPPDKKSNKMNTLDSSDNFFTNSIKKQLSDALKKQIISAEFIGKGKNSRIYKIVDEDNQAFAAKFYFAHKKDKRNRLKVEFSALKFLWEHGVRCIPKPTLADAKNNYAVYEYIEGEKISSEQVTDKDIDSAVKFLGKLDELKSEKESKKEGKNLPVASDACFSPNEAVLRIENRLKKLAVVPKNTPQYKELRQFLKKEFIPAFREVVGWCKTYCKESGILFDNAILVNERTLSPSDFGFHNTLRRKSEVVFLDLEYFGWDDPAKLIADFMLHPATELKDEHKKRFVKEMVAYFQKQKNLLPRLRAIYPLHALKWCLIMLNEFIPEHLMRRRFATNEKINITKAHSEQLAKAKRLLFKTIQNYKNFDYA